VSEKEHTTFLNF
jgi:hypothetical protein